jgi:type II secretory pathway component PulC
VVERKFVDELMANPAALATQAAVRATGDGFQLTRVRAGSLPALLGLQRGDVLTEVNGQSLDSVDKVLTMATKLRRASTLEVTLMRSGKQVRKEIQIS